MSSKIPENLKYTEDHEWIRVEEDGTAYIGITDFAQGELDELVYIEVDTVGETLEQGDEFGTVEAVKTTSELYMPVAGEILEFNAKLDDTQGDQPTLVNEDPYGEGWIVKIKLSKPEEVNDLLSAAAYLELIG
jgi:glycine cleavage system H protein